MPHAFLESPVLSIAAFLAISISDYTLTMRAARLYKNGANQILAFEGSYELNPLFVSDVDRLRRISPRFIALLGLYTLLIWILWFDPVRLLPLPQLYAFGVGATLLVHGPVHVRHLRNILVFRHAKNHDGITGRIEYARWFSYTASAVELLGFSVVYLALALLSRSWLILGGAFTCAVVALRHYRLSRKATAPAKAP